MSLLFTSLLCTMYTQTDRDTHTAMLLQIPSVSDAVDDKGRYKVFNVYINGSYHCSLRYSQLLAFHNEVCLSVCTFVFIMRCVCLSVCTFVFIMRCVCLSVCLFS